MVKTPCSISCGMASGVSGSRGCEQIVCTFLTGHGLGNPSAYPKHWVLHLWSSQVFCWFTILRSGHIKKTNYGAIKLRSLYDHNSDNRQANNSLQTFCFFKGRFSQKSGAACIGENAQIGPQLLLWQMQKIKSSLDFFGFDLLKFNRQTANSVESWRFCAVFLFVRSFQAAFLW